MKESSKLLLLFLRMALWNMSSERGALSLKEFKNVMALAEVQTVFGLVFDVLKDRRIEGLKDKKTVFDAMAKVENIKRQNVHINKELTEFAERCNQQGIDFIVVKGQTIGCLYPKHELRQAGDVDFLFSVEPAMELDKNYDIQRSKMSMIFPEVQLPERMLEGEVEFTRNGILYELHTSLRGWAKKIHQEVWECLMDKEWKEKHFAEIDGVKVRTLSPTLNAAYIFVHLFFHFIREGVSLRQICDWAVVLHHYKNEINKKELIEILSELDMTKAYKAFGSILIDDLGLPASEFPFELSDNDRKWHDRILEDIFKGGNFGKLRHQARKKWKYKYETMRVAIRNTFRYYWLCPSEVGGMIPRLVKGNLRIMMKR